MDIDPSQFDVLLVGPKVSKLGPFLSQRAYRVVAVEEGGEALQLLSNKPIHVVCLELELGDLETREFLDSAQLVQPNAAYILLDDPAKTGRIVSTFVNGIDCYVPTPPDEDRLFAQIGRHALAAAARGGGGGDEAAQARAAAEKAQAGLAQAQVELEIVQGALAEAEEKAQKALRSAAESEGELDEVREQLKAVQAELEQAKAEAQAAADRPDAEETNLHQLQSQADFAEFLEAENDALKQELAALKARLESGGGPPSEEEMVASAAPVDDVAAAWQQAHRETGVHATDDVSLEGRGFDNSEESQTSVEAVHEEDLFSIETGEVDLEAALAEVDRAYSSDEAAATNVSPAGLAEALVDLEVSDDEEGAFASSLESDRLVSSASDEAALTAVSQPSPAFGESDEEGTITRAMAKPGPGGPSMSELRSFDSLDADTTRVSDHGKASAAGPPPPAVSSFEEEPTRNVSIGPAATALTQGGEAGFGPVTAQIEALGLEDQPTGMVPIGSAALPRVSPAKKNGTKGHAPISAEDDDDFADKTASFPLPSGTASGPGGFDDVPDTDAGGTPESASELDIDFEDL